MRKRVWQILESAREGDTPSRVFQFFILTLIALNVAASIVSTVKGIEARFSRFFYWFEVVSVIAFTIEYVGRVWSCVEAPEYTGAVRGRLRFIRTPLAAIDLIAILPFYLSFLVLDLRTLRVLRLVRLFRVVKLSRYSKSIRLLGRVLRDKREELVLTGVMMFFLIIVASSFMYYAENEAQPEIFSDIPSAMWWSVVTLTTVGYGDIYPVTPLGKIFGGIIAVLGIGMFAIPAGVLGAGFVDEMQKQKEKHVCPHCGKALDE